MELDNGDWWLLEDLEILCWSGKHLLWSLGIGLPAVFIWIIGSPLIAFAYLYRKRNNLDDIEVYGKFRMLYQGLKTECFYWEFVNLLRKTVLVLINVFLNLYPNIFKALLSLLVLVIFMKL